MVPSFFLVGTAGIKAEKSIFSLFYILRIAFTLMHMHLRYTSAY